MERIEERVRELILDRFGSIPKFAAHIGLPAQTVYTALRNDLTGATAATMLSIAEGLDLDPFPMMHGELVPRPAGDRRYVDVPLYGTIAAGQPQPALHIESYHPIPAELHEAHPDAFLLRVSGESMNRQLPDGCYALIDPRCDLDVPGEMYAIAIGEDDATIKRARRLENGLELSPDSDDPTFRTQVYDFADPATPPLSVVGRVVWMCVPPSWNFDG